MRTIWKCLVHMFHHFFCSQTLFHIHLKSQPTKLDMSTVFVILGNTAVQDRKQISVCLQYWLDITFIARGIFTHYQFFFVKFLLLVHANK